MQVNRYFDDQVLSLSFENSNGKSTVGLMAVGTYEFTTSEKERIVVLSGALMMQRRGDPELVLVSDGEEFHVARNEKFVVEVTEPTAYLCEYG